MELNEYQYEAQKTAVYGNQPTLDPLVYSVLALCGETGELANKLKKSLRAGTRPDYTALADETGDILWYVAAVCESLGWSMEDVARMNLKKLAERRAGGTVAAQTH